MWHCNFFFSSPFSPYPLVIFLCSLHFCSSALLLSISTSLVMAPAVCGSAFHNGWRQPRFRAQGPWRGSGWSQRARRARRGAHRGFGSGGSRGSHRGSVWVWGTLGAGASPSPAQPAEVPVQRQQQTRPVSCGGRVSQPHASNTRLHPVISSCGSP